MTLLVNGRSQVTLYHIVIRCHMLNMVSNKLGHRKYSYHGKSFKVLEKPL